MVTSYSPSTNHSRDIASKADEQSLKTTDSATSPFPSPAKSRSSKEDHRVIDCHSLVVPANLGNDLVEEVRRNTGLSYKKSCIAVETVLGHLGISIPEVSELMDRVYKTIAEVRDIWNFIIFTPGNGV